MIVIKRQRHYGFTLMELLIVLAITGLTISLVGPLAFEQLDKFRAQDEVLQFKRDVVAAQQRAFINEERVIVTLENNSASFNFEMGKATNNVFDFINFERSTYEINRHGLIHPNAVKLRQADKSITISFENDGIVEDVR